MYGLSNGSVSSDIEWLLTCISRSWAIRPIDAVDVLCAQLTRDLFAIAKFLYEQVLWSEAAFAACLAWHWPDHHWQCNWWVAWTSSRTCVGKRQTLRATFVTIFSHMTKDVSVFVTVTRLLSRASILTRDIDIANLSVCLSVCPSVRYVPVSDEKGLTCQSFFTVR